MRDWILNRRANPDGSFNHSEVAKFVREKIPRKDDWLSFKNRIMQNKEKVEFIAKISVHMSTYTDEISFCLPDLGVHSSIGKVK